MLLSVKGFLRFFTNTIFAASVPPSWRRARSYSRRSGRSEEAFGSLTDTVGRRGTGGGHRRTAGTGRLAGRLDSDVRFAAGDAVAAGRSGVGRNTARQKHPRNRSRK